MQTVDYSPTRSGLNLSESWVQRQTSYKLPIVPTYSRNGIDNHRIAEKARTENILQKFLIYLFKKLLKLFLEIAPFYKKQFTLHNMCLVPLGGGGGGVQYRGWHHDACGGNLEYRGGCSVPWGN